MRRRLVPCAAALAAAVVVVFAQVADLAAQTSGQPTAQVNAAPAPAAASDDVVVARVAGAPIYASLLHRRMSNMAPFQLRAFGSTPEEIQRGFLDRVLVPELLQAKEAETRRLAARPEIGERLNGVLRTALLADLRREASDTAVTEEDVAAFYKANLAKFVAPEKVAIWRILVGSEAEAKTLLAEVGASPDPKKWAELARAKSLDKTSGMRGGNLGFVEPDGQTSQRGVKVDPALLRAVATLKDGDLAPAPVREGDGWAIVWKRQTMRAVTRPLDLERQGIRQILGQERVHSAVTEILATLRGGNLTEEHPEIVDVIAIDSAGELSRALRPGTLPRSKRAARPQPEPSPLGPR